MASMSTSLTNEAIIGRTLGCEPERGIDISAAGWKFSRWRHFVGTYRLEPLPEPVFVVHIGGKADTRLREGAGWSETRSVPGCATIVPAGKDTNWRVDGELDVVTVSMPAGSLPKSDLVGRFDTMRFAFSDELGVALTRQLLSELYKPATTDRIEYVSTLTASLRAHLVRLALRPEKPDFPTSETSGFRVHHIIQEILANPDGAHSVETMAEMARLTASHFSHVFKKATGMSPHQFVLRTRLDKARQMLTRGDLSIGQIADVLGFASQSHFTRAFRNYGGQTPAAWRANARALQ